jgi:hypothetical protein
MQAALTMTTCGGVNLPIDLHVKAQAQLVAQLVQILPKVEIYDGCFVNSRSLLSLNMLDKTLPANSKMGRELHEYIDDDPASHFFSEYINMTVGREAKYESEKRLTLIDVPSFNDIDYAAKYLVAEMASLPWQYSIYHVLWGDAASLMPTASNEVQLSPTTRLVRITDENIGEFPDKSGDKGDSISSMFSLFGHPADALTVGRVVFVTEVTGFIGRFAVSEPLRRAESRLRAFLGLCLAIGVLETKNSYMPSPPKQHLLIQRVDDGRKRVERDHELDDEFNRAVSKLGPVDFGGKFEQHTIELWNASRFTLIREAYKDSLEGRRLQLAARWHFDSIANSGELLAFVQSMVCLEIILGDQSEASEHGLGETIRNRCAYLIGGSIQNRQQISDDLKDIYRVRSKIVHTGQEKLSGKERGMLFRLRQLCSLVLQKELEIAAKE